MKFSEYKKNPNLLCAERAELSMMKIPRTLLLKKISFNGFISFNFSRLSFINFSFK